MVFGTLNTLSRLKGIETSFFVGRNEKWQKTLNTLSRLKGIETLCKVVLKNLPSWNALNTLSRLKGIETNAFSLASNFWMLSLNTLSRLKGIETESKYTIAISNML